MSEWMSVETMMPEMEDPEMTVEVLMYFGSHVESANFYLDDDGSYYHVLIDGECMPREPTHWMPLPEPPKEG